MLLLTFLLAFLFGVNNFAAGNKYNVLFIVVDDLRPALGIYNDTNAYSPNIDKLAKRSVVFKSAFAQQALCAPSRNSFLTSRRPDTLRLYDFYSYWRKTVGDFTTLPQHFKNNGYVTHSVGKIFHPGVSSNFTDDYPKSWTLHPFHPASQAYKNAQVCLNESGVYATNIVCPVRVQESPGGTLPDLETLNAAMKFLQSWNSNDKPYFLGVGFHKPHIPLKYPRKYLDFHPIDDVSLPHFREKPRSMPTVACNPWNDMRLRDDIQNLKLDYPFGRIPDIYTRKIIQSYSAAVTYVDDLIGNLLKQVNLDETVVVLLGDHGVSMGEHGQFSKYSNFDIATRVPLLIHVPKFTQKTLVFEQPVELLDVFPTLVDFTTVSNKMETCSKSVIPTQKLCTQGKSLFQDLIKLKLNDQTASEEEEYFAISQYPRPGVFPTIKPDSDKPKLKQIKIMGYSIRSKSYRYTEWIGFDPITFYANWTDIYARELYSHVIDPSENMNLADLPLMVGVMKDLRNKLLRKLEVKCEN